MNRTRTKRHTANGVHTNGVHKIGTNGIAEASAAAPLKAQVSAEAPTTASNKPTEEGRGVGGKFAPGNRAGRGNPHHRKMAALRAALTSAVDEQKLAALGAKLYEAAMAGDWIAAKLLIAHTVGRPAEAVDPDRVAVAEFRLLIENPTKAQVARALIDDVDPARAVSLIHELMDAMPPEPKAFSDAVFGTEDGDRSSVARQLKEEEASKIGLGLR